MQAAVTPSSLAPQSWPRMTSRRFQVTLTASLKSGQVTVGSVTILAVVVDVLIVVGVDDKFVATAAAEGRSTTEELLLGQDI